MNKSTSLNIPQRDRRAFSVRAEEYGAIWRARHRLDRMWESQRKPQDTRNRAVFGPRCSDSMNLAKVDAKMNSPHDFLVRTVRSSSHGYGSGRSKSLLHFATAVNFSWRYYRMSSSTLESSNLCSKKT